MESRGANELGDSAVPQDSYAQPDDVSTAAALLQELEVEQTDDDGAQGMFDNEPRDTPSAGAWKPSQNRAPRVT